MRFSLQIIIHNTGLQTRKGTEYPHHLVISYILPHLIVAIYARGIQPVMKDKLLLYQNTINKPGSDKRRHGGHCHDKT